MQQKLSFPWIAYLFSASLGVSLGILPYWLEDKGIMISWAPWAPFYFFVFVAFTSGLYLLLSWLHKRKDTMREPSMESQMKLISETLDKLLEYCKENKNAQKNKRAARTRQK